MAIGIFNQFRNSSPKEVGEYTDFNPSDMEKIVVLRSFYNPLEARIVYARLLDSGIACYLSDEYSVSINQLNTLALGGVKLHMFEYDVPFAESMLTQQNIEDLFQREGEENLVDPVEEQTGGPVILCTSYRSAHVG
ncbi:hypothetical protein [Pedobacter sp. KBW06]|uniref:hypothetical protein n=1 Tax=Pedobacter sp. KBW06 TaxID=2153359 RepID=UPI001F34D8CB|nr:hypothetical protein [Pedobacter sp. KBW06]